MYMKLQNIRDAPVKTILRMGKGLPLSCPVDILPYPYILLTIQGPDE
jgi:hypothetical protein